jgi:hypothetical protein
MEYKIFLFAKRSVRCGKYVGGVAHRRLALLLLKCSFYRLAASSANFGYSQHQ